LPTAILPCSRIPLRHGRQNRAKAQRDAHARAARPGAGLCAALSPGGFSYASAIHCAAIARRRPQRFHDSANHRPQKEKIRQAKSPACRTGCKPDTSAPALPMRDSRRRRRRKKSLPCSPATFISALPAPMKNSLLRQQKLRQRLGTTRGLALGYAGVLPTPRAASPRLAQKAKADTLLSEYTLFWTRKASMP